MTFATGCQLPVAVALVALLAACASSPTARTERTLWASPSDGAVACVERHAARVGAEVLAEGGHAVDAAVATAFALAVTWPPAGNLGGGGVMVVRLADGTATSIDARETAPLATSPTMFLDADGRYDPAVAEHPFLSTGVPGTLRGLELAHRRFGRLPWRRLVEPAIALADDGFVVDAGLAAWLRHARDELAAVPASAAVFLGDDGEPPAAGERLVQPDLAETLRAVARDGADAFYEGDVAGALVDALRAGGSPMTLDDLARYEAVEREPIRFRLAGREVVSMPPPSSGGVAVAQMAGQLALLGALEAPPDDVDALHLRAEVARRAFADRARHLGDPDHVDVPVEALLAPEHLMDLALSIDPDRASSSHDFGPPVERGAGHDTTHLSVVDGDGHAVSLTLTLEAMFGGKAVAAGTGVLLNDELRDFNRIPGRTTPLGQIGTAANLAGPRRRPLTSMTPTIVAEPGGPVVLVTGSPGGRTIINTVLAVALAVVARDEPLDDAIAAPRLHHGWWPDEIAVEPGRFDPGVLDALRARGHRVVERPVDGSPLRGTLGAAHSIARDPATGRLRAVGDPRRDGWAATPGR